MTSFIRSATHWLGIKVTKDIPIALALSAAAMGAWFLYGPPRTALGAGLAGAAAVFGSWIGVMAWIGVRSRRSGVRREQETIVDLRAIGPRLPVSQWRGKVILVVPIGNFWEKLGRVYVALARSLGVELTVRQQHAFRALEQADKIFGYLSALLPKRIADEEIGDALEDLHDRARRGRPSRELKVKIWATTFWVVVHVALHYLTKFKSALLPGTASEKK